MSNLSSLPLKIPLGKVGFQGTEVLEKNVRKFVS